MAKNSKDEGAGQAAGADQKPDVAADPKAGAEYQKTAAEPVAEPKKDDEVAQLKTEERSIASRLLKARVTREQAQVEEQRRREEQRDERRGEQAHHRDRDDGRPARRFPHGRGESLPERDQEPARLPAGRGERDECERHDDGEE